MTRMTKILSIATFAAFAAQGAMAADLPSPKQCRDGYKAGMQWTKKEFDAACVKVMTKAAPSSQKK
jgi:hypothetical protein